MCVLLLFVLASCTRTVEPIRVGTVYPLTGYQGQGGEDEFHGVQLAADLVNEDGGVNGHPIEIVSMDAESADAAPQAVASLHDQGIDLVLGSYGSTISSPAAEAAARRGMLFWETGAVGDMTGAGAGDLVFRVAPTGVVLGRAAIDFIADELAPLVHRDPASLRFAVANVDDSYGVSVARGAVDELSARGLTLAGRFPYDPRQADITRVVRKIARSRPDVLFVAAYLDDGIALRRETITQGLHLVASIGTSSSYCMPEFGAALGRDAVGLFASDKPYEDALNTDGLTPEARDLLARAGGAYRDRYGSQMSAAALAGFSGAWALFRGAMPMAASVTPSGVAAAARSMRIPQGGLPNGSGIAFGAPGTPDAGANLRAASVIWEWVGVGREVVVWPPRFAESEIRPIELTP
jgi:branched-chain amino acid transport system substrate-binding protein